MRVLPPREFRRGGTPRRHTSYPSCLISLNAAGHHPEAAVRISGDGRFPPVQDEVRAGRPGGSIRIRRHPVDLAKYRSCSSGMGRYFSVAAWPANNAVIPITRFPRHPHIACGAVKDIADIAGAIGELRAQSRVRHELFQRLIVALESIRRGEDYATVQGAGVDPSGRHTIRDTEFLRTNGLPTEIESPDTSPGSSPHTAVGIFQARCGILRRAIQIPRVLPSPSRSAQGRLRPSVWRRTACSDRAAKRSNRTLPSRSPEFVPPDYPMQEKRPDRLPQANLFHMASAPTQRWSRLRYARIGALPPIEASNETAPRSYPHTRRLRALP